MKINKIFLGVAALATLMLGACDDTPQGSSSSFPTETQTFTASPTDTVAVTFTANSAWQLSSDAMWCKVDGLFLDTSGKAGEQRVAFVITADGQSVDASKAHITLRMGDESGIIAIITRRGITDAIVLGNDSLNYTHGETLTIGTSGSQSVVLRKTTFDSNNLHISTNADWFEVLREDSVITLSVKPELLKYSQCNTTDSICFSNLDVPMMRLNVQYTGMDAQSVYLNPASLWALRVATDGLTYKETLYETVYNAPIEVNVSALNDSYTLYRATYDKEQGCTLVAPDTTLWFTVCDDKVGHVSISFDANSGSERTGYVFVLPNAISDALPTLNEVAAYLFDDATGLFEVKAECEQYLIAQFAQESSLANSFHLIDGPTFEYLEIALETEEMWIEFAQSMGVTANNLFKAGLEFAHAYILNPMLPLEVWDPSVDNGEIQVIGISGKQYTMEEKDFIIEPTLMEAEGDEHMLLQFRPYIEEQYIIFFVDANKIAHKALVVTPIL